MSDVARLRNMGPTTAGWLTDIGIRSAENLDALGAAEAYRRLKAARPAEVTVVALYALEAALLDVPWTDLPLDVRERLREEADAGRSSCRRPTPNEVPMWAVRRLNRSTPR